MKKQLAKIEEFVTSIESTQMSEDQQSLILSAPVNVIGGMNGSGQCTNYDPDSCGGVNKRCTNHGVCGTSDNTRNCTNNPIQTPSTDTGQPNP